MNHPYQIHLTQPEWGTLIQNLTQVDDERQRRINAFFDSISQDVRITREGSSIVIQSDLIDEDAIIAALEAPKTERLTARGESCCYRIVCSSVLSEQDNYQATSNPAEYDGYRELLISTPLTTSTYETQVDNDTLAAA